MKCEYLNPQILPNTVKAETRMDWTSTPLEKVDFTDPTNHQIIEMGNIIDNIITQRDNTHDIITEIMASTSGISKKS